MLLFIKYLVIAILLLKFSYSTTTDIQGRVNGRVLTPQAMPLKNSVVSLASDSLVVRITRTNEKGYFLFDKLPKGNYRILIMITGYEKYTTGFFNLTQAKPSREFKDIELQPLTP
ncbi:MAG: carboxypeptidase-like regulatory domain-containing protein [Bacteroidota bacterium]